MRIYTIILLTFAAVFLQYSRAQQAIPGVAPTALFTDKDGMPAEVPPSEFDGQAPLDVTFRANPQNMEGHTPVYTWHFRKQGSEQETMVRYEEDTDYRFEESGTITVTLTVTLSDDGTELDPQVFTITIHNSLLSFPNAFSPNGDDDNPIFKAKTCQSIVDFHAYIFNRWGQKLYEWTDPTGGWDGTYRGRDVKEGTYFLLVRARGADGVNYNIKKDVNLLRGYTTEPTLNE